MGKGQQKKREAEAASAQIAKPPFGNGINSLPMSAASAAAFLPSASSTSSLASLASNNSNPSTIGNKALELNTPESVASFYEAMEKIREASQAQRLAFIVQLVRNSSIENGEKAVTLKASQSLSEINNNTASSMMQQLSLQSSIERNAKSSNALSDMVPEYDAASFIDITQPSSLYEDLSPVSSALMPNLLAAIVEHFGITSIEAEFVLASVGEMVQLTSALREEGLFILLRLIRSVEVGLAVLEPWLIILLPMILHLHADKSSAVKDLANKIATDFSESLNPNAFPSICPALLPLYEEGVDWKSKLAALEMLKTLAPRVSAAISPLLPLLVPQVTLCIIDTKKQIAAAGVEALTIAGSYISNEDIQPLVPQLVSVIARPDESAKTLDLLLETTFVSQVDGPTLALIAPLLNKALKGRSSVLKRKAARVIDSMCRLVQDPADVAPFVPLLLPQLDRVIDEIADDEVRTVATTARAILMQAMGEGKVNQETASTATSATATATDGSSKARNGGSSRLDCSAADIESKLLSALVADVLNDTITTTTTSAATAAGVDIQQLPANTLKLCAHIAKICAQCAVANYSLIGSTPAAVPPSTALASTEQPFEQWRWAVALVPTDTWEQGTVPYLLPLLKNVDNNSNNSSNSVTDNGSQETKADQQQETEAAAVAKAKQFMATASAGLSEMAHAHDNDGNDLCDIEFSLAFGGKILLHNTRLKMGRGRKYGIMGKNGAGKTTLLTNIGSGNIEGIPATLKTVYVQHDDRTEDNGVALLDELMLGADMIAAGVTRAAAETALRAIEFTDEMLSSPRSALSGGWKMKVLIVRAMLSRADVLLLDEPTNHLDKASVQWLTQYLQSAKDISCLIVTHDTAFMDDVVTDIIHYENKKLVYYPGTLRDFVAVHPEAKHYYELQSNLKFIFPVPERLDGVNSTTRAILKMENCSYTYPGAAKPTLTDVNVKVCLASRIAVLGRNGAGKSTLIKMLVQETQPDPVEGVESTVWKHHNLRIAYVAQHSFHHIEEHLDCSPVDYIKWRFAGGVDKESMEKANTKMTEEELLESQHKGKQYGDVEEILGRRKNGRTMEYECTWVGQGPKEENLYISLEKLQEMGLSKVVEQVDARIAAVAAGLDLRPLIIREIQGHLDDFGLEAEFGTHGTIRRMSGGQKVKLVLAAAMWNRPHLIVLDEPTNYLDREALGALTQAIKGFGGGVVIISHNSEFTDAICTENWNVGDGKCVVEGEAEALELKAVSLRKIRKEQTEQLKKEATGQEGSIGNTNKTKAAPSDMIKNPKSLEFLTTKEIRRLTKSAQAAGVPVKEFIEKLNKNSPEWKWL